eukprot:COSAG03_NODE_5768_length_1178_cov_1.482854_3_plen_37_part_01
MHTFRGMNGGDQRQSHANQRRVQDILLCTVFQDFAAV